MLARVLLALWTARLCVQAAIEPDSTGGVVSLCSNANCVTRHSFYLILTTSIGADASVTVEFPAEYTATNLGLETCSGFATVSGTKTQVPCSVQGKTVTWTLGQVNSGSLALTVEDVMNPGLPGTTGYFKVRSFKSAYQVESNEAFASLGITASPASFMSSTLVTTSGVINTIQSYQFQLKSAVDIPASSWLRVKFPSGFSLDGSLSCSIVTTLTLTVPCAAQEAGSRWVVAPSITAAIQAGSFTLSVGGIKNPSLTGQPGFIQIQLLSSGGYKVLQISSYLQSPVISPGLITGFKAEGTPLNQGQEVWYTITASLTNAIPEGGYFRVIFPSEFGGVTNCVISTGFITATAGTPVSCNYKRDVNSVFLSGFQAITSGSVGVRVKAVNPQVSSCSNFVLQSMLSNGNLIDTVTVDPKLTFKAVPAPSSINVDTAAVKVTRVRGENGPLELTLDCKTLLPLTPLVTSPSTIGQIIVDLPDDVQIVSGTTDQSTNVGNTNAALARMSCLFGKNRDRAMVCDWDNTAKTITINTPSNIGLASCPMAIVISPIGYGGTLGFAFPTIGTQTVKIQTLIKTVSDVNPVLKEEANLNIQIPPKQFSSPTGVVAAGSVVITPLHNIATKINLLKIAVTPSIDLPTGFALEFEFAANGAFSSTLALGTGNAGETLTYPCFYDSAWGTFGSCVIKVGSATTPTVVQLLNAGAGIAAADAVTARTGGTPWTIYFPNLVNGAVGVTPTITVRSKIAAGQLVETQTVTLPAFVAGSSTALVGPNLTPTSTDCQESDVELTFTVAIATALATGDQVYISFPTFENGATASPTAFTVTACGGGMGTGAAGDYQQFNSNPILNYLYTASGTVTSPLAPCIKVPQTMSYSGSLSISVYIIRPGTTSISESGTLTWTINQGSLENTAAAEIYVDTAQSFLNQPSALYRVDFDTVNDIPAGGSISILFDGTKFTSVDGCYDMTGFPTGTVCTAQQGATYMGLTYQRVMLTGWTATFAATTTLKVWAAVTSGNTSGSPSVVVVSNWGTVSDQKIIDSATLTVTLSSIPTPSVLSVAPFLSPYLSHRTNDFAPLTIPFIPTAALNPSTSSTSYTFIQVTLPTSAIVNMYDPAGASSLVSSLSWAPAAGGWLYCTFGNVRASRCEQTGDVIKVYTPTSGTFTAGTMVKLTITTMDATNPQQVGFKAPGTEGNYQFKVGIYTGSPDAIQNENVMWYYLGSGRFTNLSVTSHNKSAGEYTVMRFSFKAGTALAASASGGVVMLEFPFDAAGNGKGWVADLGTGLAHNSAIDCYTGTGTTADTGGYSCKLLVGRVDYVRISISNFVAVSAGGLFDLTIAGIKNPTALMTDLTILVRSSVYDASTAMNPKWTYKDMAWFAYVETTMMASATTESDTNAANTLSDLTQGSATANFQIRIPVGTTPALAVNDEILVKVPKDFTLAGTLTTCTYATATTTCIAFPITGWVLVTITAAPTGTGYQQLAFGPVTNLVIRPSIPISAYLLKNRKTTNIQSITIAVSTNLVVTNNLANLKLTVGATERYCFKIQLKMEIPKTGSVTVTFPAAYTSIDGNSCMLGDSTSQTHSNLALSCTLTGQVLRLYGFAAAVPADTFIEMCVNVVNPLITDASQSFVFDTYYTTDSSQHVETSSSAVVATVASTTQMAEFSMGVQYKPSVQVHYVLATGDNTGPLVLTLTPGVTLTTAAGTVKLTSSITPTLPTGGELRCIWATGSTEYISTCELSGNDITVTAPATTDLAATTAYTLTVTTINSYVNNGIVWGGSGVLTIDVEINSDGATPYGNTRVYTNISPIEMAKMTVDWDHQSANYWNRFTVTFDMPTGVNLDAWASGGRILVEFPAIYDSFGYDSFGLPDGSDVSCVTTGLTAVSPPDIHCYFQKGDEAINKNAALIVTGFDAITAPVTGIVLDFDSLKNPNISGDDKIVWVQVSAIKVDAGWPGTVLATKRLDNLFALSAVTPPAQTNVAQLGVTGAVGETGKTATVQLKLPGTITPAAGDIFYVVFKNADLSFTGISESSADVDAVKYYPMFNFVIMTMAGTGTLPLSIALGGMNNPSYQPDDLYYFGYYIHNKQVVATYQSATGTNPALTLITTTTPTVDRADGLTPYYKNDILDLKFSFTLAKKLPKNGALVITLTTSTFTETYCYSDASNGSALTGTYTCTITSSNTITLIPTSSDQLAATALVVTALVKTGATDDTVTFKTKADNTKAGYWIEGPTGLAVALTAADPAPNMHKIPIPTHYPIASVQQGTVGNFQFSITIKTEMTANVGVMTITLPGFDVAPGGDLRCIWGLSTDVLASSCVPDTTTTAGTLTIVMKAPTAVAVPAGACTVTITTVNANSPDAQGLQYPATAKTVTVGISIKSDGNTVNQDGAEDFMIMNGPLTSLNIEYGHRGHNQITYVKFSFKAGNTNDGTGRIRIYFPTKDLANDLFELDLGLGIADNVAFPCHTENLGTPTCTLHWGMPHIDRPSYVDITSFSALDASTTTYTVSIDGIKNPKAAGTDDRIISFRVAILDSANNVLVSQNNPYVYSILSNPAVTPATSIATAPNFSGKPYDASGLLTIPIPTEVTADATSKIFIIFPFKLNAADVLKDQTDATAADYVVHVETNWAIISCATLVVTTAKLSSANFAALYVGAVIRVLITKGDVLIGDYNLQAATSSGTFFKSTAAITVQPVYPSSAGKMNSAAYGNIMLYYPVAKSIAAGGCFKFKFAGANTSVDKFCTISKNASGSLTGSNWTCDVTQGTPKVITFKGFKAVTGGTDKILVIARASFTTDIGAISIETYNDAACTQVIETDDGTTTTTPPILEESTDPAPLNPYFRAPTPITRLATKGKTADFSFNFTPRTTLTATSFHHIVITASTNLAVVAGGRANPFCSIKAGSTDIAAPCAFAGTALNIFPGANLVSGTTYTISLSTQGEDSGANGFVQPATNIFQYVTLKTYTSMDETTLADTGIIRFATPDSQLTSLKVSPVHYSPDLLNVLKFEFQATVAIASTDTLTFEFPSKTEDGSLPLFADDLGLGLKTGTVIGLKYAGFTTNPTCFVKNGYAAGLLSPKIKCTGGIAPLNTALTVEMPVKNPTATDLDSLILHFRVALRAADETVKAERWVFNAFALYGNSPSSTGDAAAWNPAPPTYGKSEGIDITLAGTPTGLIIKGTNIDMSGATGTGVYFAFSGVNIVYVNSPTTTTQALTGFTASGPGASAPVIRVLTLGTHANGRSVVTNYQDTTLTSPVANAITATATDPTTLEDGNWYIQDLTIDPSVNILSSYYLEYEISGTTGGTYADVDPGFLLFSTGFSSSTNIKWKFITGAAKKFVVWGFSQLTASTSYTIQVYVKLRVGTASFTANAYTDETRLSLFATGTVASPPTPLALIASVTGPVSVSSTPSWKVGVGVTGITLKFTATTNVASGGGAAIVLQLDSAKLNCAADAAGVIAAATVNTVAQDTATYASTKATATLKATLAPTTAVTLAFTFTVAPVCTPATAGYLDLPFYTTSDGTTKVDYGTVRIFIQPATAPTFTMESYVLNLASPAMMHANLVFSTALSSGQIIVFSFPVLPTTTGGFDTDLGMSDSGADVPITSSDPNINTCVLRKGSTSNVVADGFYDNARIACLVTGTTSTTVDITFLKIKTPSATNSAATTNFEMMVLDSSFAYTRWATASRAIGYFTGTSCSVVGTSKAATLTANTFYSTATYTLTFTLSGTLSAAINDYLYIELGSAYDISGVTISGGIETKVTSPVSLVAKLTTAGTDPTVTITGMKNPAPGATTTITVYPNLKGASKCANAQPFSVTLTAVTLTSPTLVNISSNPIVFYPNQDILLTLSFVTPTIIPATGSIEITFPAASFGSVQYGQVEATNLSNPVYAFTSPTLTISGFTQVAASATITLKYLYAPLLSAATAGSVNVDIKTKVGATVLGSGTAAISVTASSGYLLSTQFSSRLGALFGKDASDPRGTTIPVLLRFHFKTTAAVTAGTEGVVISLPTTDIFKPSGTGQYFAFFQGTARLFATSVVRSGTGPYDITVMSPLNAGLATGTEYDLYIGANSGDSDGLDFQTTSVSDVTVKSTETAGDHIINGLTIPGAVAFTEFFVQPFTMHEATQKPYWVHIKTSISITEIHVEFPPNVYTDNPFTITTIGGLIDCGVKVAGTYVSAAVCKAMQGDSTSPNRNPAYVRITGFTANANDIVNIVIGSIKTPAAGTIGDVTVYSRETTMTGADTTAIQTASINQFMTYRNALIAQGAASGSPAQPWASVDKGNSVIGNTATYTISLAHTDTDIDTLLVSFPSAYSSTFVSSVGVTSPASTTYIPIPAQKLLFISLSARSVASATALSIVLTNVENVGYQTASIADAALTIYSSKWRQFIMTTVVFSGTIPATPWTEATASITSSLADNTIPVNGNHVLPNYVGNYVLDFKFEAAVPAGGVVQIDFPTEYQGGAPLVYATVSSTSVLCTVTAPGATAWVCPAPSSGIAKSATITIHCRGYSPSALSATTSHFKLHAYKDAAKTIGIASNLNAGDVTVVAGTDTSTPWNFYVPVQLKSNEVATKAGESNAIVVTFEPATSLVVTTGTVVLTPDATTYFPNGTSATKFVALFENTSTKVKYMAGNCVQDGSGVWTVTVPVTQQIVTGTVWKLIILTQSSPDEAAFGLTYPANTIASYNWAVVLSSGGKFKEVVYNPKAVPTTATVTPVVSHQNYANSFYRVTLNQDLAATDIVYVSFPIGIYDSYLGQTAVGDDLGCDSDQAAWTLTCKVVASRTAYKTRDVVRIQVSGTAVVTTTTYHLYLGGIKNPSATTSIPWITTTVVDSTGLILAYTKQKWLFQTSVLPTVPEVEKPSFLPKLATANKEVYSTAGATTDFSLGVALNANDFIVLTFSHAIDAGSDVTSYGLGTITKTNTILCNTGAATLTDTDPLVLTGLVAPAYVQAPSITAYIFRNMVFVNQLKYYDAAQLYTALPITVVGITLPYTGSAYKNVLREFAIELKINKAMAANAGFKVTFPSGFTLIPKCATTDWVTTAAAGNYGFMPCTVSGSDAIVKYGLVSYGADYSFKVRVWGTAGTTFTSPLAVTVKSYIDSSTLIKQNGEGSGGSLTVADNPSTISVSAGKYIMTNPSSVSRGDDYGSLKFSFKSATLLTKAAGTVTLTLPTTLVAPPASTDLRPTALGEYRCLWLSTSGTAYLASACAFTVAVGGDTLVVTAPANMDIPASQLWTVSANTVNVGTNDGFKFSSALGYGSYAVQVLAKGDGTANGDSGSSTIFLAPKLATEASLISYSNSAGLPTALKFHLKPATNVPAALEVASGTSMISIVFDSAVMGENLGSTVVATAQQTNGVGVTDCAAIGAELAGVKCYIRRGDTNTKRPTEVLVRGYAALATTASGDLLIVPLFSPATVGKIVHARVFVETFATGKYTAVHYMEFNYLYMTQTAPTVDSTGTLTYGGTAVQGADTTLTFSVAASPLPIDTNQGLALFLTPQPPPNLTSITLTTGSTGTLSILSQHHGLAILPSGTFTGPADFSNVSLPMYVKTQNWSAYFMVKGATVKYQTYSQTFTVSTLPAANFKVAQVDTLSGPYTNRANLFAIRVKPALKVPAGGSIQITYPAALGNAAPYCKVEGGLQGAYSCVASGTQTISITGFDLYDGTVATTAAILVSLQLTTATLAASASLSFGVTTYGVAVPTTEQIETATMSLTLEVKQASATFFATVAPMMQGQWTPRLGEVAVLTFNIKPRVAAYTYKSQIIVQFPLTADLAAGATVGCSLSNGANIVPSPCTKAYASSQMTITVTVPEQLPLQTSATYMLSLNVYDSGSLATDGFTLPTVSEAAAVTNSGKAVYYVQVKNASGTLVEGQKVQQSVCGTAFAAGDLSLKLGTTLVNAQTFLDLSFKPTTAIPAGGAVDIELPTTSGLGSLFPIDLGLGATSKTAIACDVVTGFPSTTAIKCDAYPVSSVGSAVKIRIYNFGASVDTATTHRILIGKVKNPAQGTDSVFSQALISRVRVAALTSATLLKSYATNELTIIYPNAFSTSTAATQTDASIAASFPTGTLTAQDTQTLTYQLKTATTLNVNSGYVVLDIGNVFVLPASVACGGLGTTCSIMKITGINWLVAEVATGSSAADSTVTAVLRSPEWKVATGYPITAYVYNGAGVWTDTMTATVTGIDYQTSVLTSVTCNFSKNKNTYDFYTITVTPAAASTRLARVTIKFPTEYQWVDNTCKVVSGLEAISSSNPISCVSDCATLPCSKTLTITNFKDTTPSDAIVVKVGAYSPATPSVATSNFEVTLYALTTGTDGAIEKVTTSGSQTILDVDFPSLVNLEMPQTSQFNRVVKAGSSGDIIIRMVPKLAVPAGTGRIEVILPDGFIPVSGATPICLLESGMLYYATDPLATGRSDLVVTSACTYSSTSKTVTVPMPAAILKEWNGFGTRCSRLIISAKNSAGVYAGYTMPASAGYYPVTVTTFSGATNQLETSTPTLYLRAPSLDSSTFTITQVTKTVSSENILKLKFKVPYDTTVGYLTFANNIPQEMSTIELEFETYQSFATDLGKGYIKGSVVPCVSIAGLVGNTDIQCTFVPGDMNPTTPLPAKVLVNNFKAVTAGTEIELHLLRVKNPATVGYVPRLSVSIYRVSYDGTTTDIAYPSTPATLLPAITADASAAVGAVAGVSLGLAIKTVDGTGLLTIPLKLGTGMSAGDSIYISFPSAVSLPSAGLTVAIKDYSTPATPVAAGGTLVVQVYPSGSILTVALPATQTLATATNYAIEISGFVNPPYLDTCASCPLSYFTAVSTATTNTYASTGNFWTDLSIESGQVTGFAFTSSPDFKADTINAQFVIKFSPVPRVPAGSKIIVTFPTQFPSIGLRSPPATCTTSLSKATCAVLTNSIQLSGFSALASGSAVSITIQGGKNPGVVGTVSGFTVSAMNPQGKVIIGQTQALTLTMLPAEPAALLTYSLIPETYTSGVSPSYRLKVTAAVALPTGTVITLTLPFDFAVSNLKCVNLSGISSYQSCGLGNSNVITLVLNENVAGSATMLVTLQGITNPLIPNTATAGIKYGPIEAKAVYDGKVLAINSPTDANSFLTITLPASNLQIASFSLYPINEAEKGFYNLTIISPALLFESDNIAIRLLFPSTYTRQLVPSGVQLYCGSTPSMQKCAVREPNEVRFEVFTTTVPQSSLINLIVYGVANPLIGETGQFNIQFVNQTSGAVISATDSAGSMRILGGSGQLLVLSMTVDDEYAGSYTNMDLKIDVNVTSLAIAGEIVIDWPTEYTGLFTQTKYECQVTSKIVNAYDCTWPLETNRMRTIIPVLAPAARNYQNMRDAQIFSIRLIGIPNPKTSGKTSPFGIRYLDRSARLVLSSSYENAGNNTLTFKSGSQPIGIPTIQQTVTAGTYTGLIPIELGLSPYNPVAIRLSSDNPGLIFSPQEITLQYVWNTKTYFKVGALRTAKTGTFSVTFTKYEGDRIKRYQPPQKLEIIVLPATNSIPITIGDIPDQPTDVPSLPIPIILGAATVYPLYISLVTGQGSNITLTPGTVLIREGEQTANFTLKYTNSAKSGMINGTVFGDGSAPYISQTYSSAFTVIATTIEPLELLQSEITNIQRTSATGEVRLNGKGQVWYMYTTKGTKAPSADQLVSKQRVRNNAKQFFGASMTETMITNVTSNSSYYLAELPMEGLKDNTKYTVFFAFKGQDEVLSDVETMEFTTLPSYPPAKFTIFTLVITSPNDIVLALCIVLGIPRTLLQYIPAQTTGRRLDGTYSYDFVIAMDRNQDAPAPATQIAQLDTAESKSLMQMYLPTLDPSPSIGTTVTDYNSTIPMFVSEPGIAYITNTTVTVNITQNTNGQIYAVILERNATPPNAEQIINGLDGDNIAVPDYHFAKTDCLGDHEAWLKFTDLVYFLRYRVWFAGTNDLPGSPLETPDEEVKYLNLTSGKLISTVQQQTILLTWADDAAVLSAVLALFLA